MIGSRPLSQTLPKNALNSGRSALGSAKAVEFLTTDYPDFTDPFLLLIRVIRAIRGQFVPFPDHSFPGQHGFLKIQ
jgi:hypothetical protein